MCEFVKELFVVDMPFWPRYDALLRCFGCKLHFVSFESRVLKIEVILWFWTFSWTCITASVLCCTLRYPLSFRHVSVVDSYFMVLNVINIQISNKNCFTYIFLSQTKEVFLNGSVCGFRVLREFRAYFPPIVISPSPLQRPPKKVLFRWSAFKRIAGWPSVSSCSPWKNDDNQRQFPTYWKSLPFITCLIMFLNFLMYKLKLRNPFTKRPIWVSCSEKIPIRNLVVVVTRLWWYIFQLKHWHLKLFIRLLALQDKPNFEDIRFAHSVFISIHRLKKGIYLSWEYGSW